MSKLPKNWSEAPIRTLMRPLPDGKLVHQGWSPQCESGPARSDSDWGALKTTAIQDGAYLPEHNKRLPDSLEAKERLEVHSGDLLMTCAGPRVRCGVACLVRETPARRFISGKMYRFRANDQLIDPRLLEAFLRTPETKTQIDAMKTGISESGMNITHERFSQLDVPVAPRHEQTRIADKLDTVLARVDACRDRLARVPPLLKRFRQSVLAAATSGRLTEDWRGTSFPFSYVKLGDLVAQELRNGKSVKDGNGPRVLRLSALRNGAIDCNESKLGDWNGIDFDRYLIKADDFLVSRGNGSKDLVGRGGLVEVDPEKVAFPDTMIRIRPRESELLPSYLRAIWDGNSVRTQIEAAARTTAGIYKISQGDLESLKVPLPTIPEQTEIVRRVESLFAFADRLEARLTRARSAAEQLAPALLAKAFRGELVPQDPEDAPAAELLKRLAAGTLQNSAKRTRRSSTAGAAQAPAVEVPTPRP